jgi:hypothetical protein
MAINRRIHFRYLDNNRPIYIVYRPFPSSRTTEYYTEKHKTLQTLSNVLQCYTNRDWASKQQLEKGGSLLTTNVESAKNIAAYLKLPLLVTINNYCNIHDLEEIEEAFFWGGP